MNILPLDRGGNGNTRPELETKLSAHCDYLRITATHYTGERLKSLLEFLDPKYIIEEKLPWSAGAGAPWYDNRISGVRGLRGGWSLDEDERIKVMLDLPGEYWEMRTPTDQWRIFRGLKYCYNVRCCRVDTDIDDPSFSIIPVEQMRNAYYSDKGFGFRKYRHHITKHSPEDEALITDEYGGRNSGRFVRVYNHENECQRMEAEFKRGYAPEVFDIISDIKRPLEHYDISSGSDTSRTAEELNEEFDLMIMRKIAAITVGAIDFRDRGKHTSRNGIGVRDSRRLPFYQKFIDFLETTHMRVKLPAVPRSVHRTHEWIKRQVSGTLATIKEGLGTADYFIWMNQLLGLGFERMDRRKFREAEEISKYKKQFRIA